MSAVGITENAKGDNKKFEIWCNSRDEVFIVQVRSLSPAAEKKPYHCQCGIIVLICLMQAPTPEIKTSWVNEIRKVLTQQLQACRGTVDKEPHKLVCMSSARLL